MVSGDKRFETSLLIKLFKENQILHLLVLSGGNIAILIHFMEYSKTRNSLSYIFFKILLVCEYFVFTAYQHPVARALLFMILDEFVYILGFKICKVFQIKFLLILSVITFFCLNFSLSFALSAYFAMTILIYNILIEEFLVSRFFKRLFFPIYMTAVTAPIALLIFKDFNPITSLRSNFLLLPIFEIIIFLSYFIYFLTPILSNSTDILNYILSITNFILGNTLVLLKVLSL